jgi:hypothetical protein
MTETISYAAALREIEAAAASACADAMEATIKTLDRYEAEGVPKDEQDIDYAGVSRRAVAVNLNVAALTELTHLIELFERFNMDAGDAHNLVARLQLGYVPSPPEGVPLFSDTVSTLPAA